MLIGYSSTITAIPDGDADSRRFGERNGYSLERVASSLEIKRRGYRDSVKHLDASRTRTAISFRAGMTLVEVVVSVALTGLVMAGIVSGYVFCANSAQKSALSLAATAQAMERLEEARGARWDTAANPLVDQLDASNFPVRSVVLDLNGSGTATNMATVAIEISQISTNPPLRRVHADCIWQYRGTMITNSVETCRAPNQ